jgi:Arc/MetJ-type ribon-helix-helix transcriptional regulator
VSRTAKAKLSVSITMRLINDVDRSVAEKRYPSRSAAIETALRGWAARERALSRDAAIDAYFLGVGAEERTRDKEWADFAYDGFIDMADRDAPRTPKRRRARHGIRKK